MGLLTYPKKLFFSFVGISFVIAFLAGGFFVQENNNKKSTVPPAVKPVLFDLQELNGFALYPKATFIKKETIPPCTGDISGFSVCDSTTYTFESLDDYDSISLWYTKDTSNSGWICSGSAGSYTSKREASSTTTCAKESTAYALNIVATNKKTEITIVIPQKK